jgi:vacuolar-type H+-ATPase subunit I/STV1
MRKVTIITPPEYEGLILGSLGKAGVLQLKPVSGTDFKELEPSKQVTNYDELYKKFQTQLVEPLSLKEMDVERVTPSPYELRSFSNNPEAKVESIIDDAKRLTELIQEKKEEVHLKNNRLVEELQEKIEEERKKSEEEKEKLLEAKDKEIAVKARLESVQALEPQELKNCFAVGIIKNDAISDMSDYLDRREDIYYKTSDISENESLIFVFGSEESEKWVQSLFLIFDVKDIFDVLDPRDVLLVLDPNKRKEAIEKYRSQLADLKDSAHEVESTSILDDLNKEFENKIDELKKEYEKKIEENNNQFKKSLQELQMEQSEVLGKIKFYSNTLRVLAKKNTPILRSKVVSVVQGYTPEYKIDELMAAVNEVEEEIGEKLYVEISELEEEDHHAPTPEPQIQPNILQPAWILTRLRGWPSAEEINPAYISVLIFSFQFGLMFGDIGQGLIFLVIGLVLRNRFKRGMMKYLTTIFIPMGTAAVIFGFLYDSIFLKEHAISHWLHQAHIELPFHYPVMPNPVHEIGELMNLIFLVGAIEIVFGALLGAANAYKEKDYVAMLGEHGIGMGLYVTGLYLSAGSMFTEGLDVMALVANWPFKLMVGGMLLSFVEPVLHSIQHGHGLSIESLGEGLGGLLMTFVEGLANMFSFLRIAAFALAHASLAGAGEALGHAIGSGILGLAIMNVIALTFEFVSSSVQSLRLLYYEFMGKFYHGEGIPFRPFRVSQE